MSARGLGDFICKFDKDLIIETQKLRPDLYFVHGAVVAFREIAEETVRPRQLHESVVQGLQRVLPEDEEEADEIGSLSQSAEAMRLSAAAPARSTSVGGDYEG